MLAFELSLAGVVLLIKTRKTKSNSQRVIVKKTQKKTMELEAMKVY